MHIFFPAGEAGWCIGMAFLFTVCGMLLGAWMTGTIYGATGSYTWSNVNAIAFNVMNLTVAASLMRRYSKLCPKDSGDQIP